MPKKRRKKRSTVRSRKRKTRKVAKRKLAGFTKTKGKFALVFKRGRKLSVGKSRYSTKKSLVKAARKHLK